MSRGLLISILMLGGAIAWVSAQSVANVAKKERERQQEVKSRGKTRVITERDLKARGGNMTQSQSTAARPVLSSSRNVVVEPKNSRPKDLDGHDQAYWRQRKQSLQEELERAERRRKELDDFLAANHTAYTLQSLAPIKNERDQMIQRADIIRQRMQALEEEARKAGAPPAWLR